MSYRPITDVWILARSKVKYYGAFPAGYLHRARALLGVGPQDAVLHVCAGRVRDYPYRGLGPFDQTLDLDASLSPDFVQDARKALPSIGTHGKRFRGMLIDRPYSEDDATHYAPGPDALPQANVLVKNALASVEIGEKVGIIDYVWPHPGKAGIEVAVIAVGTGRNNRARWFTVFERLL